LDLHDQKERGVCPDPFAIKVFNNSEIGVDAVLASACLPFPFQAIEIDGEAYWDVGYTGNPPIFPLIYNCSSSDVLIVQLSPMRREEGG
jgi:NTE family protein